MKQRPNYRNKPNTNRQHAPKPGFLWLSLFLTLVLTAFLYFLRVPLYLAYIAGINIVTFGFYGYDKSQAKKGGWRVPELILHFLALIGGAAGGLAGQWLFYHKVRKQTFHIILWASLLVHLLIFVVFYKFLVNYNNWSTMIKPLTDFFNRPVSVKE